MKIDNNISLWEVDILYCSNCGCKLEEGINFCPNCGKAIKVSDINNCENQYIESNTDVVELSSGPSKMKVKHKTRNIVIISCLAALIILIVVFISLEKSPRNYLTGTWVYTKATSTKVQFREDGSCILISGSRSESCTYELTDNNTVLVYNTGSTGSARSSIKFTIVNKDTLQLNVSGNKLIFKKIK